MLRTLEAHGLTWDGAVEYQSARIPHYEEALRQLTAGGRTFECSCSRRERAGGDAGYPGTCRQGPRHAGPTATRFRVDDAASVVFEDRAQGTCRFSLSERGDVIVRRRDGAFAYQLAVVVDDALQSVTDVVRGADLLDNTPWQVALQHALGLATPLYMHLPLVVEPTAGKLSKSRRALALDAREAGTQLHQALTLLRQAPPPELKLESPAAILAWACARWSVDRFQGIREVSAPF
jgi:glutamyl-Q tRNA(Asp) synthetase